MPSAVVAAIITGCVSLILALYNFWAALQQHKRLGQLEERRAELAAKLDYEYEARKRLYNAFEPTLFQLLELAEYALNRIKNLTNPKVWRDFSPGEPEPPAEAGRPPMASAKYEVVSTLYGLFAPLVVIRSMSRGLTLVDLSLEKRIKLQYDLASHIYDCVKDDFKLAEIEPVIPYDPFADGWRELRKTNPRSYWWQGLTMGRLETVLDLMTVNPPAPGHERLMSFGEFERLYEGILDNGEEKDRKTLAVATNAFTGFHPAERPVFCRMLIVQARLYQALLRTREGFDIRDSEEGWKGLLELKGCAEFEWKLQDAELPALRETLAVTDEYFRRFGPGTLTSSRRTIRPELAAASRWRPTLRRR